MDTRREVQHIKPGPKPRPAMERLLRRVEIDLATSCWIWQGARNNMGYGVIGVGSHGVALVHVVVYSHCVGPVPEGLELDHLCRVRHCCNPDHADPVTHQENVRRGEAGTHRKTQCKRGHAFTPENTYLHAGDRHCRACKSERQRAYRAKAA